MMSRLEPIAVEFGVSAADLTIWIERRWISPSYVEADVFFDEADRARLRMIIEFRRDLEIDDDTMPVVLDLIDRLYATRAQLRAVLEGVATLPSAEQVAVLRRIQTGTES
jgi:chaperone modulatory protein CbpM